jgi:hypothetical protein
MSFGRVVQSLAARAISKRLGSRMSKATGAREEGRGEAEQMRIKNVLTFFVMTKLEPVEDAVRPCGVDGRVNMSGTHLCPGWKEPPTQVLCIYREGVSGGRWRDAMGAEEEAHPRAEQSRAGRTHLSSTIVSRGRGEVVWGEPLG